MIDINDELSISSFLNFGYDVKYKPDIFFNYSKVDSASFDYDYKKTKDIFMACIERAVAGKNDKIVVPISGGLDSRALLASLLEVFDANRIKTYTFGTKNTYDFEIGQKVSEKLGVKCKPYELENYDFTRKTLYETSAMFNYQTTLFYHPPYDEIKESFNSDLFLIGFMGDPLAGSHLPLNISDNPLELYQRFSKKNQMVKSCFLIDFDPFSLNQVLDIPENISDFISIDEYVDFEVRQLKYVYPHVMPRQLNCVSPFLDPLWFEHMLSLPNNERMGMSYYIRFLQYSFPFAFDYPCKNNYGLKLGSYKFILNIYKYAHKISFLRKRMVNYQDFNKRIKEDGEMYSLLESIMLDLKKRRIGLNVDPVDILKRHKKSPLYSDAILNLASLEINLSASE